MTDRDPRLAPRPLADVPALVAEGARDWNAGAYWEAHEAWEAAWHALRAAGHLAEAGFLHGLILATAGVENLKRGKTAGFVRQTAHGLHKLRANAGRGAALGVEDEERFVEALTAFYLDATRRTGLTDLAGLGRTPPDLLTRTRG